MGTDVERSPSSPLSQIASLGSVVIDVRDLATLLDRAVLTLATGLGLEMCGIFKMSSAKDRLRFVARAGWPESVARHGGAESAFDSQERFTLRAQEPVVSNVARETRFGHAPLVTDHGAVCGVSVVIAGETLPFGVLSGYSRTERSFSQEDVDFVRAVAHIVTGALRRAHHERDRARLASVVDSAREAIIEKTPEGIIFSWNAAAERLYGYSKAEVLGKSAAILVPTPATEPDEALETQATGERLGPYETIARHCDGTSVSVEVTVSPIVHPDGRIIGSSKIARDLTRERQGERVLRMHADILAHMPIGVIVWRLDDPEDPLSLRLVLANSAGGEAAAIPLEASIGQRIAQVFPEATETEFPVRYAEVVRTGAPYDFGERSFDTNAASPRIFRIQAFPLPDQCVGVTLQDVTAERRLTEQLHHAQRMDVIGQLAGGIAHDFNNLLMVIIGNGEFALKDMIDNEPAARSVHQILRAADSGSRLAHQLLAFSRRQVLRPTVLNLSAIVDRVRGMLTRIIGKTVQLTVLHSERSAMIHADAGQIEQVVLNLAVNARDAMPNGGRLMIETAVMRVTGAGVGDRRDAPAGIYAVLAVSDTGVGMDNRTRERIFEPFFTTKPVGKGTGLGLSTVYGIVKQSGGHISVDSEPGHGTTFRIYLPIAGAPADETVHDVRTGVDRQGSETVLLDDDDSVPCNEFLARPCECRDGLRSHN